MGQQVDSKQGRALGVLWAGMITLGGYFVVKHALPKFAPIRTYV